MSDSHKYQVVLPRPAATQLDELARDSGEKPSTLAAQLIRHGLAQAAKDGKLRPLRQAPVIVGAGAGVAADLLKTQSQDTFNANPASARAAEGAMVDRRPTHRHALRPGMLASADRRVERRPARGAFLPGPTDRVQPPAAPRGRRRGEGMEAWRAAG